MSSTIPTPDVDTLLPPLLAHLPIAASSPAPPSTLLPLLSPILRQRVTLLANSPDSSVSSPADSWLALLTWSSDAGSNLAHKLAEQDFSPHPNSGEIECENELVGTRRTDEETLKARVALPDAGVEVVYVWVSAVEDKDEGAGWRVHELRLLSELPDAEKTQEWYQTVQAAEDEFSRRNSTASTATVKPSSTPPVKAQYSPPMTAASARPTYPYPQAAGHCAGATSDSDITEDDDDYWDMYDRTPARTPAVKSHAQPSGPSEDEYFAQYASVEPALDHSSAEEEKQAPHEPSHIHHSSYHRVEEVQPPELIAQPIPLNQQQRPLPPSSPPTSITPPLKTHSPIPQSPTHSHSSIDELERAASRQTQAETAVRQHIATTVKSMWRLARMTGGMDLDEFRGVVEREVGVLGMLEEEQEA